MSPSAQDDPTRVDEAANAMHLLAMIIHLNWEG